MAENVIALLVAAGHSTRLQAGLPKPYLLFGQESLLRHTVKLFLAHPQVDGVRVVIRREHHALYKQAVEGLTLFSCVVGGDSRQESVRLGLESVAHRQPQRVLVHDVARPLVSAALISRVIEALDAHQAVIPALPVADTLKCAEGGVVTHTVDREKLFAVQTPQGFRYAELLAAHRRFRGEAFTDDALLLEKAGIPVNVVTGDANNFKITTPADIDRMQQLLANQFETRTGLGYDVHQLRPHAPGTPAAAQTAMLCGIAVPSTHFLLGHSDADVGLHALVDALLGAIADGDIGTHFSPHDPRWQQADSSRFVLHALERVQQRGGEVVHVDITLICEQPKIMPYRVQMVQRIAQLLAVDESRVSVKATTTEKLGFTGRGEGIAAQAVASVRLPR